MALIDRIQDSNLGLKGVKPTQATYPNHVFDPKNDPNRLALFDEITILHNSTLDLDGKTPEKIKGSDRSSATHVLDKTPGVQGDEEITFKSVYAPTNIPSGTSTTSGGGGGASNFETGAVTTRA
jgi:hypothetical protein